MKKSIGYPLDFASLFLPPQFLFPPYSFFEAMDFPGKKILECRELCCCRFVKTWWLSNGPGLPLAALSPLFTPPTRIILSSLM